MEHIQDTTFNADLLLLATSLGFYPTTQGRWILLDFTRPKSQQFVRACLHENAPEILYWEDGDKAELKTLSGKDANGLLQDFGRLMHEGHVTIGASTPRRESFYPLQSLPDLRNVSR